MAKVIGFLIGFGGALYCAFLAWTGFIVPLVPAGDYHGLILVALGVVFFIFGGGLVFGIAMLIGALLATLFGTVTASK